MMNHIQTAAKILGEGGIIAYPTEAVWGLGCDPYNQQAVEKLLKLKQRPVNKGLILIAADIQQLEPWLMQLTKDTRDKVINTWPGPYTWVLPDNQQKTPSWIRGDFPSFAVRVTGHATSQQLCRCFGNMIVSTSANLQGEDPALSLDEVQQRLGSKIDYILPGELGGEKSPSQITDAISGTVLR